MINFDVCSLVVIISVFILFGTNYMNSRAICEPSAVFSSQIHQRGADLLLSMTERRLRRLRRRHQFIRGGPRKMESSGDSEEQGNEICVGEDH